MNSKRLTTREAAAYLGISLNYLRNMRHGMYEHPGPEFVVDEHRHGIACYYEVEKLDAWKSKHPFRKRRVGPASMTEAA